MKDGLLQLAKPATKALLGLAVLLAADATVAQVALLGVVVDRDFLEVARRGGGSRAT